MARPTHPETGEPLTYSVPEAARALSIGRRLLERYIFTGEIKTFVMGNRRLISRKQLAEWVDRQTEQAS